LDRSRPDDQSAGGRGVRDVCAAPPRRRLQRRRGADDGRDQPGAAARRVGLERLEGQGAREFRKDRKGCPSRLSRPSRPSCPELALQYHSQAMNISLAGTGAMGVIHMKALKKIAGVNVISVNSRTEESGRAFAAEWGIPHYSTSLEESIDRPGVDAVILTTPSAMHADQAVL